MTDSQKIEKLAKWLGLHKCDCVATEHWPDGFHWVDDSGIERAQAEWNPFTNIADAWMLVENWGLCAEKIALMPSLSSMTAPEASRAIADAMLEVLDD